jgi:hypothetical protein
MGLRQAVELVLEGVEKQLEAAAKEPGAPVGLTAFLFSVRLQLKLALTASDDPKPDWRDQFRDDRKPPAPSPEQLEKQAATRQATRAEEATPVMVQVVGGPEDGVTAPVSGEMPVGAFTQLGGVTYALKCEHGTKYLEFAGQDQKAGPTSPQGG